MKPFMDKNCKRFTLPILTATLLLVLLVYTPIPGVFAHSSSPEPLQNGLRIKLYDGTSTNWSGYVAQSSLTSPANGFVKNVIGSWTIPTLTCQASQNTFVAIWVGIDGSSSNTVEQLGTEQDCINGVQQNSAWFEEFPRPSRTIFTITVHPGDMFTASVTHTGTNGYIETITDITTGKSFSKTVQVKAKDLSAEWIVEAPATTQVLPLANFGTVSFSNSQYTDSSGITHPIDGRGAGTFDSITMNNPSGAKATPSSLTDSGGSSSFTVTYSH